MDELLVATLGKLGLASLGWIVAWIQWKDNKDLRTENNTLRDKILAAFVGEAEMKANLLNAFNNLTAAIKGAQK